MKKRTPQGIALILVLFLALFLLNKFILNGEEEISIEGILNITAHDINKSLPLEIDEYTRLDKALYIPPQQLQFNYTLHNMVVDSSFLKTFRVSNSFELLQTIKQDSSLKLLKDNKVIFVFQYSDTLGNLIHKFTFGPETYK